MHSRLVLYLLGCVLFGIVALPTATIAAVPAKIHYQGHLTAPGGVPLPDAQYPVRFRIYDAESGGTLLWDSGVRQVQLSGGLLSYLLGDSTALPEILLQRDSRLFLGVQVGADPEMFPRTLLSSVPSALQAQSLRGVVETGSDRMVLKSADGDSAAVLSARSMGATATAHKLRFFDPDSPTPKTVLEMSSGPNHEAMIRWFDPQSDPPDMLLQIGTSPTGGPTLDIFDKAGQVMGVEPSPFNSGLAWRLFDPQPEPPGKMFEVITEYTGGAGASAAGEAGSSLAAEESTTLRMYSTLVHGADQELVQLSAAATQAELRMGPGAPIDSNASYIVASAGPLTSRVEIAGPQGPLSVPTIVLSATGMGARVGIGTSSPSQELHVNGSICYSGAIGACSDIAFKKDIEPISGALEAVDRLEGVRYRWRTEDFPDRLFGTGEQIGLIAQQVKDVIPEAVTLQDDGYYTVDYSRLTPVLLEAIKELKKQNEELSRRLEALETGPR